MRAEQEFSLCLVSVRSDWEGRMAQKDNQGDDPDPQVASVELNSFRTDHDEQHFELTDGFQRMRTVRGKRDGIPGVNSEVFTVNLNVRLSIKHNYEGVKGRGVFAQ